MRLEENVEVENCDGRLGPVPRVGEVEGPRVVELEALLHQEVNWSADHDARVNPSLHINLIRVWLDSSFEFHFVCIFDCVETQVEQGADSVQNPNWKHSNSNLPWVTLSFK